MTSWSIRPFFSLLSHIRGFFVDISVRLARLNKRRPEITERELIQKEIELNELIFGTLPEYVKKREFFNLNPNTWIWYEEQELAEGRKIEITTKYEVQPQGVLKTQTGSGYRYIEGAELQNFILAVKSYYELVMTDLYQRDPQTGQAL